MIYIMIIFNFINKIFNFFCLFNIFYYYVCNYYSIYIIYRKLSVKLVYSLKSLLFSLFPDKIYNRLKNFTRVTS